MDKIEDQKVVSHPYKIKCENGIVSYYDNENHHDVVGTLRDKKIEIYGEHSPGHAQKCGLVCFHERKVIATMTMSDSLLMDDKDFAGSLIYRYKTKKEDEKRQDQMGVWSFKDALGDTIMEKYESLYVKLMSIFDFLGGPLWIICGQDIADIFETSSGHKPEALPYIDSTSGFRKLGRINNKFDVYVDENLKEDVYVCGKNGVRRLTIKDYLVNEQQKIEQMYRPHNEEWCKCRDNFTYFASNFIKITHPKYGLIPFELYEYQKRIVNDYESHRFNIMSKFRQGGATTTTVLYCLWLCMFNLNQHIMVVSVTDSTAKDTCEIVKTALDNLPDWLKPKMGKNTHNKREIVDTNSSIHFTSPGNFRPAFSTHIVLDDPAFIPNMEDVWSSLLPSMADCKKCIVVSTLNHANDWFEGTYRDAVNKRNSFHVININYKEHPHYSKPEFIKATKAALGERKWLQEFECKFI